MKKAILCGFIVLTGLALAACTGSSMPVGGGSPTQLTYELTPLTGAVNPGSVEGDVVEVTAALGSNDSALPDGFTGVQGMHFYPALPPDSGFTGYLNVRLSQIAINGGEGYDGALLYLYYMDPVTGEANFVDSSRASGEWVNFQVNMLGYFVIADNNSIHSSTDTFAAFAFADLTSAVSGAEINFWAVAINGSAPYQFEWWMGDGNTVSGDSISYSYTSAGEYNVRVTITDSTDASTSTYSSPITITADGAPLISDLNVTHDPADPVLDYTFDVTVGGGAPPFTFNWDFDGDGADDYSGPPPVAYTFPSYGIYEGILEVLDSSGQSAIHNFVSDARSLSLASTDTAGLAPHIAVFTIGVNGLLPGDTLSVDFGDNTSNELIATGASTLTTAHTYESPGAFQAQALSVKTIGGVDYAVDSNLVTVNVSPMSAAPFIQVTMPIVPMYQQDLEIFGYNFGDSQGSRVVTLEGLSLFVQSWSDSLIKVEFPAAFTGGQGQLNIMDGGSPAANPIMLTIDAESYPTSVQNIIPTRIEPGGRVIIFGHGFGPTPVDIDLSGVPVTVDGWSESAVTGIISNTVSPGMHNLELDFSPTPISFPVEVVTPTGGFPILTDVSPTPFTVASGDTLTLTGSGFGNDPAGCIVFADAFILPYDTWSDTSIELFDMLPSVETFAVVINHQRCSNPLDMEVNGAPLIELVSPDYGAVGDMFNIYGHSFGVQETGDRVLLGTTELIIHSWMNNDIIAELPAGVVDGDLVVHKHLASNAVPFDVIPPAPDPPNGNQI